jgi:diguanylate cyclase (GGDEF)-like protein
VRDAPPATTSMDELLAQLSDAQAPAARLSLLLEISEGLTGIDARKAQDLAGEAADLAASLNNVRAHAEALYRQGQCADMLLDHPRALDRYGKALAAFEAQHDESAVAKTLRAISFVHDKMGDLPRALDYQFRALEIDERTGDTSSRAATLRTIGIVFSQSGDPQTGLDYYRQSLALCDPQKDAVERGKTLNNIGINYKNLGRFDQAFAALTEAQDLFAAMGLPLHESATLNNLGLVQERLGDVKAAEATLRHACKLSETTGYRYGVAHASLGLGRLCFAQNRMDEARTWLETALAESEAHHIKATLYESHEALADYFDRAGDAARALYHHRRFHDLEREVMSEATSSQLRGLKMQFEVDAAKREAEAERERQAVLTRANAELQELNISLTEANLQKTVLLDQLERQTFEDALTGLANRRRLDQRLEEEFALSLRHNRPLAVAIADLDHFKLVNDRFSHAVGDAVLRTLAKLLRAQVRHTDLVARFGGEEFVLLLVETDATAALRVCEKLRESIQNHPWHLVHPDLTLTLSVGVCANTKLASHERMLAMADRNLYAAKASGRNRVVG